MEYIVKVYVFGNYHIGTFTDLDRAMEWIKVNLENDVDVEVTTNRVV